MYGPNQVGEVIIGNAQATEVTAQAFINTASDKEIKAFSANGTNVAANVPFKYLQFTAGNAAKGLNYEFSDVIDPANVELITVKEYAPEIQKLVTFTVGTATANTTYEAEIRLYNDGGTLSPENFAVIQGFWVTNAVPGTTADIAAGLSSSLNKNIQRRGGGELIVTYVSGNTFTVAAAPQTTVPGKILGKQIEFDAIGKSYPNAFDVTQITQNTGNVTVVTTTAPSPGSGTGKWAVNYEWFVKGMKYEVYRGTGYPVDFNTPYYATTAGFYNVIQIRYFAQRNQTLVERQYKVLTIMIDKVTNVPASNAATNSVLADLRTACGTAKVPANLAVV